MTIDETDCHDNVELVLGALCAGSFSPLKRVCFSHNGQPIFEQSTGTAIRGNYSSGSRPLRPRSSPEEGLARQALSRNAREGERWLWACGQCDSLYYLPGGLLLRVTGFWLQGSAGPSKGATALNCAKANLVGFVEALQVLFLSC